MAKKLNSLLSCGKIIKNYSKNTKKEHNIFWIYTIIVFSFHNMFANNDKMGNLTSSSATFTFESKRERYFRGRVSHFNQSEARKH